MRFKSTRQPNFVDECEEPLRVDLCEEPPLQIPCPCCQVPFAAGAGLCEPLLLACAHTVCSLCVDALQATPEPVCGVCACPLHVVGPNPEILCIHSETRSEKLTIPLHNVAQNLRNVEAERKCIDPVFAAGLERFEEAHLGALALAKDTYDRTVRALEETRLGMLAELCKRNSGFYKRQEAALDVLVVTQGQMMACDKSCVPCVWSDLLQGYRADIPRVPVLVDVRAGRWKMLVCPRQADFFLRRHDPIVPSARNVRCFDLSLEMADLEAEDIHLARLGEPLACEVTFTPGSMSVVFDAPYGACSQHCLTVLGVTVWEGYSDLDAPNLVLALKAAAVVGTAAFKKTLLDWFGPLHAPDELRDLVLQGMEACLEEDGWAVCHRCMFAWMLEISSEQENSAKRVFSRFLDVCPADGLPPLVRREAVRTVENFLKCKGGLVLLQTLMTVCPDWTEWASSSMATAVKGAYPQGPDKILFRGGPFFLDHNMKHVRKAALRALGGTPSRRCLPCCVL